MTAAHTVGDFSRITHLSVKTLRHYHQVGAAGIGQVIGSEDVLAGWQGALGELHASVKAQDLRTTGPFGGLYASELFQHGRGEATVFIPVEGSVRAIGRVVPIVVPAAELAIVTHHGPLADDDLSYAELGSYVTTHEISIDGPMREYYLCGLTDTPDQAKWRTEIGWPIFRADASR